ncbi:hypothetical protein [Streptomyces nigra]|uniref:hypothetical protein n=1 Tax=Streptomyces nigra TaxID=1827580 RepID=UPI00342E930B
MTSRAGGAGAALVGALADGAGVPAAPDATGPGPALPEGRVASGAASDALVAVDETAEPDT